MGRRFWWVKMEGWIAAKENVGGEHWVSRGGVALPEAALLAYSSESLVDRFRAGK